MIALFVAARDEVIKSTVCLGTTNYQFALNKFFPLLNRFGQQRKIQSKNFYARLKSDIVSGCVMPPITLAFVNEEYSQLPALPDIMDFVNRNIDDGYILDGMQRLNTLKEASNDYRFVWTRPINVNVIIAERYDLLLYRMITLNNGQKPMTARHQIEMLTKGSIDRTATKIPILTEKETEDERTSGAFRMSDIVEAYVAFLSNNVNNQNKKIIESKLDEILVQRVMDSEIASSPINFSQILDEVARFYPDTHARTWLKQVNNLIGFTVGTRVSYNFLKSISVEQFSESVRKFDLAFTSINPSKVNVGRFRRELSSHFFSQLEQFIDQDVDQVVASFIDHTITD